MSGASKGRSAGCLPLAKIEISKFKPSLAVCVPSFGVSCSPASSCSGRRGRERLSRRTREQGHGAPGATCPLPHPLFALRRSTAVHEDRVKMDKGCGRLGRPRMPALDVQANGVIHQGRRAGQPKSARGLAMHNDLAQERHESATSRERPISSRSPTNRGQGRAEHGFGRMRSMPDSWVASRR